ncbi:hypothetical protein PIROE2DRAFT_19194 [Piromyces sp. E2]|nr:hypothetical protein PIROE2DRAFT_19194 [Piromyces sp. E2]|eukprot:OUM56265.1 hypothetical protein PIROE2DRAFT_19194 [Piromyces sp. E2]
MDQSLYNGNYPIINTIYDTETETGNSYSFIRHKHSQSSHSDTTSQSSSQSNNSRLKYSLNNNWKNNKNNNSDDEYNNMSLPSPVMSEKIKNNHLKLNEEKIYISPKQFNTNRIYNNYINNSKTVSENTSIFSSQYSHDSKQCDEDHSSSYYTYTTSNSYFISEMGYTNESKNEETPKTNKTKDDMKKQKYNESIMNDNLQQFLIYDKNDSKSPEMKENEKNEKKLPSNSNHRHRHRHRHHHHYHHDKASTYNSSENNGSSDIIKSRKSDYSTTYSITTDTENVNQKNIEDDEYYRKKKIQEYLISSNKENNKESENIIDDYNIKEIIPNDYYISDVYTESYSNDITSEYDKMSYNSNNTSNHISNSNLKTKDDKENTSNISGTIGSLHSKNITNKSYLSNNTMKSSGYQESVNSSNNKKEKDTDMLTIFDIANNYVNSKTLQLLDTTE